MRRYFIILFLLIIVLISATYFIREKILRRCHNKKLSLTSQKVMKLIKEDKARGSDFVSFVKRITLKLPDSLFIASIPSRDIALLDSFLVFIDRTLGKLFIFNTEGKFLKVYGEKGKGPGEFLSIDYFAVDRWNKLIYIYDGLNRRFSVFDLKTMNFKKVINLADEVMLRHFCVDSAGNIYIHHPPFGEYRGFITVVDSSGKFLKTMRTEVDEKFKNYYNRGFLEGDIYLMSNGLIIESNMFSPAIFIGDTSGKFKRSCNIPDYSLELKLNKSNPLDDRDVFYRYPFIESFIVNEKLGIIFQIYVPLNEKKKRKMEYFYYNVFDTSGAFLGQIKVAPNDDILFEPNRGDINFVISTEPRLNERIPFNILVYKWKDLE